MSRKSTGTVAWRYAPTLKREAWCGRWTRGDGTRTNWIPLPLDASVASTDVDAARRCAATFAPTAKATTRDGEGEILASYTSRWLADRKMRVVSIKDDHARLRDHVLPLVGHRSVLALGRDDVEDVRDALDKKVADGELSWKTARLAWAVFRTMCGDMANARNRDLRVRGDDPAAGIKPTLRGANKMKAFLYPSEFLQFVACAEVPRDWRVAVALAIFTYGRDGEVAMLDWRDLDLAHGTMIIARGRDRDTGATKSTKGGSARRFTIEPNLMPMLRAMHAASGGRGRVFSLDATHLSRTFRRWLLVAGVDRAALHDRTDATRPITWHDLRASAATWAAVRGDQPLTIQRRCGHSSFSTTAIYIREAEILTEGFGEPFPAFRHPFVSDDSEPRMQPKMAVYGAGHEVRKSVPDSNNPQAIQQLVTTVPSGDSSSQSSTNQQVPADAVRGETDLEAAIARITKLLGQVDEPETAAELVSERKAMRAELARIQTPQNVVPIRRRGTE
jgi:integrase